MDALVSGGFAKNKASVAREVGLDKSRLSRLLAGKDVAGSKTVAHICSRLDRSAAADLLHAYLCDEAETVRRLAARKRGLTWSGELLVEVRTL